MAVLPSGIRPSGLTVPTVNNPQYFQQFFGSSVSSSSAPSSLSTSGYSSAHSQYQDERQRWATSAYKVPSAPRNVPSGQIPHRAQTPLQVRVLFQVSYQLMKGKFEKTVSDYY